MNKKGECGMLSKEELQLYYSYFVIKTGTEAFDIIDQFVNNAKGSIADLERKLGIIWSCMDMDLYKNNHFYIVLDLRERSPEEKIHSDLEKIDFKNFFEGVTNGDYRHYGYVGTGYFHNHLLKPLIKEN